MTTIATFRAGPTFGRRRTNRCTVAATAGLAMAFMSGSAGATDVRFSLDWAFQGPQAPFLLALERGYYEEEGLNVTIDRGYGSGDVPVRIAAGSYDIGFADINPTIKFNAENPDSDLVAVAVLYDASPLAAMTIAGNGITEPADLEGRSVAAPDFDAGRQLFPAFVQATGIDGDAVEWITVTPQLRETMLANGQTDAITGFLTTGILSLTAAGVPEDDIVLFRYSDYGVDLYSSSIITSRAWAEANPDVVTGIIRASIRGYVDAMADPAAAIEALRERDPLIDPEIELARLALSIDQLVLTDHVISSGFSQIDPARMQAAIDMVRLSYGIEREVAVDDVYTAAYLPPAEDLMIPAEVLALE